MIDGYRQATSRLKQTSSAELLSRLRRLRNVDVAALSDEAIDNRVGRIMDGFAHKPMLLRTNATFRARKNNPGQSFNNASELWYPPPQVVQLGRFNTRNEPVFYSASSMAAAMREVPANEGEVITILACGSKRPMADIVTTHVGLHLYEGERQPADLPYADLRADATFQQILRGEGIDKKWKLVDDLLSELSTLNAEARPDLYRLTNSFAKIFRRIPGIDGITYPSVATNLKAFNTVLSCETADKHFFPAEAWEIQILGWEAVGPAQFELPDRVVPIQPLRRSKQIMGDGTIEWIEGAPQMLADYPTVMQRVEKARESLGQR